MTINYSGYVETKDGEVTVATPIMINAKAQYAMDLAARLSIEGMKANGAAPDGKPKYYPLTAGEAVAKAMDATEKLFAAIEAKGWIEQLPDPFLPAPS
jgi:hypothetical protein